jgi:hypothetical protein
MLLTIPLAVFSLGDGGFDGTIGSSLMIGIAPVLVTFPIVLGCSLLIGLPTVAVLRKLGRETAGSYVLVGCLTGGIVPPLLLWLMAAPDGSWMALLGTFSGGVTAATWSRGIHLPTPE